MDMLDSDYVKDHGSNEQKMQYFGLVSKKNDHSTQ